MKILKYKLLALIALSFVLVSCEKSDPTPTDANRTVIVYLAANNNLYSNAVDDINEMERAWKDFKGNLIVYFSPVGGDPYLIKIKQDATDYKDKLDVIVSPTVKQYPSQNACSPTVMKAVFNDIMTMYPAESYGVVLWSHAAGWLPTNSTLKTWSKRARTYDPSLPRVKSFGEENGYSMNIPELAKALPNNLDFIIFDACLMANIETVYDLKDKADYIVASAAETLEMGFPYNKIVPHLFAEKANLTKVAEEFYNYYNAFTGLSRSATISLIKTSEIEGLAQACAQVVTNNQPVASLNLNDVQRFERDFYAFYDLADIMAKIYPNANLADFNQQLDKVVLFKRNTPKFFNWFDINKHCGLTGFIPNSNTYYNSAFAQTQWAQASKLKLLCND